jgi:hypothetical protein
VVSDSDKLFTHFVKRDEQNKYCVQVSLGGVGVIDLDTGSNIPVETTSIAQSYLSLGGSSSTAVTDPLKDLRALTVADYTFLVNKNMVVEKNANKLSAVPDKEALISVKLGDYEKAYSVYINDVIVPLASTLPGHSNTSSSHHDWTHVQHGAQEATYLSGPSDASPKGLHADTEFIARDLAESIKETYGSGASLNGITSVNITNPGAGWFLDVIEIAEKLLLAVDTQVMFVVNQGSNQSAYGFADHNDAGEVTAMNIVNPGSGYNNVDPITTTFTSVTHPGFWGEFPDELYNTLPTDPTVTYTVGSVSSFTVEQEGSVIKVRPGDRDFRIRVEDGLANQGLGLAYKEVDSIVDLPKSCFNNFTIKVKGDADIDQDDYYVRFKVKDSSNFGEGSWIETVGWKKDESATEVLESIETNLEYRTMPLTLVRLANGNFKLQSPEEDQFDTVEAPNEVGWRSRQAGDDFTNPFPSFVGSTINDVFFFKNRLGFLTDTAVVFSEADEYFNFFRTTTQQLLDSAPIDVGLSHTKVAVLQHALPFQEKLVLFSKQSQFVLRGADILSPKTVAISPVTEYDITDGIAPLALGSYIYFPFNRGQYEGVFEYFVDNNTEVFEAEEITSQVPKYVPSNIRAMAGSASESMVVLQNATDLKTLYVYKYFWSGKEKIQSAWQKWTFDDNVTGFDFIDSTLYLILNGRQLVEMPVENALTDVGLEYTLLLDNRVDGAVPGVFYNSQTNKTSITGIPFSTTTDNTTVFTKGGSERVATALTSSSVEIDGFLASYVTHSGTIYKCVETHTSSASDTPGASAKWSASTDVPSAPTWSDGGLLYNDDDYFVVGKPYDMLYRFSNQALKQPTERGGKSASDYTFQNIRNGSIEYADSGHFTVEVTPRFRDTYSYVYNPTLLSSISTLDRFTPESGHFRFGVQCRPEEATIEVKSSSALPVKLLAAEFESMVASRSRRYGA